MKTWPSWFIVTILAGFLIAQEGLAQQPVITSFQGNGQLTWTNEPGTNAFAVQWTPALTSYWCNAAPPLDLTVATDCQTTVSAPISAPVGFYKVVEGFGTQSLHGAWIAAVTNDNQFYFMSDGNGTLTGFGIFNALPGSYSVSDTGGVALSFVSGGSESNTFIVTGQFAPPRQILFTGSFSNLGIAMPVQDAALCVGNWNGTLSETNDPQGLTNYSVSLAVDTNGWGSLSNAFSGTGWIFALASTNGALSGFFNTTLDSNNPYNQFQISGTLSGNVISGSFESEGDAVGTVSLTRQ